MKRSEINVIKRAVKEQWPISDTVRADTIAALNQIIQDATADKRARVNASKVLVEMMKANGQPAGPNTVHLHQHISTSREEMSVDDRRRVLIDQATQLGLDA